jgi:prepilin-type N-terminal cleavage/methylation domain-containing protein
MKLNRCSYKKGFTLIELMVVIFIIGVLSAVAIPYMRGRTDAAKWSEGKAAAGSIRTAIRAYIAEKGNTYPFAANVKTLADLGFAAGDLAGKYFLEADYKFAITDSTDVAVQPTFIITVGPSTAAEGPKAPASVTLTDGGILTEIP